MKEGEGLIPSNLVGRASGQERHHYRFNQRQLRKRMWMQRVPILRPSARVPMAKNDPEMNFFAFLG